MKVAIDPQLARTSALARLVFEKTGLHCVIPCWSSTNINVGVLEVHHGRVEWMHRAHIDLLDGKWQVREASPEIADLISGCI